MIKINVGQKEIHVIEGELFHRYRMNPDLEEIKKQISFDTVEYFRKWEKKPMLYEGLGMELLMPCFYYESSYIQAVFTAEAEKLKKLLPTEKVHPLLIDPKNGVIAISAFSHKKTDIDPYNAFTISVVIMKPKPKHFGLSSLPESVTQGDSWIYIWKFPVNTELSLVGGIEAYNYPKHLTDISFEARENEMFACFTHEGAAEVSLYGKKPRTKPGNETIAHALSMRKGHVLDIPFYINLLSEGHSYSQKSCRLELGNGPIADVLRELNIGHLVRYDYVPKAQMILPAPTQID